MKYLTIKPIKAALDRIHEGGITHEHRTSTATSGLINNYFPKEKYISTPEQIQFLSRRKPDYTIEKLNENDELSIHAYVEVKSLINSNFDNILNQLSDTISFAVDSTDTYAVFAIAMKGTSIAFYEYQNYITLLDEYGIFNYKGFMPLNYEIPFLQYKDINSQPPFNKLYVMGDYVKHLKTGIETNPDKLRALGVKSTSQISHPHIWDLLNEDHEEHIHNMFIRIASSKPGADIKS